MRVLFATDGSEPSRKAMDLITTLFDRSSVHIHTFTVGAPALQITPVIGAAYQVPDVMAPADPHGIAREIAQELADVGFAASWSSAEGDPALEILRAQREREDDLIVLGAAHTTWMGHALLGSTSLHVLHHSPCSVIVVHRQPEHGGNVLWADDGSSHSEAAVERALEVLSPARCSFTVANVMRPDLGSAASYSPLPPFGSHEAHQRHEEARSERAWQVVERGRVKLERRGFHAKGSVLMGPPAPQILKEAENIGADLVVVGSRGLGPVRRTILGSVSDQIVRLAPATFVGRSEQ